MSFLTAPTAAAIQRKREQQAALREYLDHQCELKREAAAATKATKDAYARAIQAQVDAWKSEQEAAHHRLTGEAAVYRAALTEQRDEEVARKDAAKRHTASQHLAGTSISTGPGGLPVGTVRSVTGAMLPYVLKENAVLSTLGTTVRFDVVCPEDHSTVIPFNKERVTRTY